ncbi:MAG: hypothetical protein K0Q91_2011 [Fibrobacteria bacterium]|jgi:uncharacterized protein (TIGR02147 family)|nr:hypothetical protein [Fibrobacteria bacterium]
MPITAPNILQYAGYAHYLQDAYGVRKTWDKNFSHRYISQKLGMRSSGWFADVLAGRKRLKSRHVAQLAAIFKLEPQEREFFRVLILLEQAESPEEQAAARAKWFELKGISREKVARDRFKYFDNWYYPVLRELLAMHPFEGDYNELAARLHPPISAKEAKEALALLIRLGLVEPAAPKAGPALLMDTSAKAPEWDKIMASYMKLSLAALKKFAKEERDYSALTLTLPAEGLKKASEEIAALRQRLLSLSDSYKSSDRVYQCLFQVFPVSRRVGGTRA